jgi:hypothetical protein
MWNQQWKSSPTGFQQLRAANSGTQFDSRAELRKLPKFFPSQSMLFYVVDWLPPDFGAVGQYGMIFAREIAQKGRNVCLVGLTSGPSHTVSEVVGDGSLFEIKRLFAKRYDKAGLVNRLIWSLRTNLRLSWAVIRDPRSRGAEVLFTGSPPFMLFFVFLVKWLRGVRLTYRITDFYPEVLIAAWGRRSVGMALFQRITWFLRKRVDGFQALGEDQRRLLVAGGISPERISLKRDIAPVSFTGVVKPAARPAELAGQMVLLYSGNYGVAHEIDTVVAGLIRHYREGRGKFALWMNASGSSVQTVVGELSAAGVSFARTAPVSLDQLPALLASADAHLITLRPGFSGLVLPSKLYGCLASGRPILFVGPKDSDVHLLCQHKKDLLYEYVEPGDSAAFAKALDRIANSISNQKN